jgi:hypothetical protein
VITSLPGFGGLYRRSQHQYHASFLIEVLGPDRSFPKGRMLGRLEGVGIRGGVTVDASSELEVSVQAAVGDDEAATEASCL